MLFIFITPEEIMNTNIKINIVLMLQKKWIYLNNEIIQIVKLNVHSFPQIRTKNNHYANDKKVYQTNYKL